MLRRLHTGRRYSIAVAVASSLFGITSSALAAGVPLQNATATFTQGGFDPAQTIDGSSPTADSGGVGWAIYDGSVPDPTSPHTIVWETQNNLFDPAGVNLQFSIFAGGFTSHTLGSYRLSYTTADRSTFADQVNNVGAAGIWTQLAPVQAYSSGGAAYRFQGDNSILMSKQNPNLSTDRILAKTGPLAQPITGFRLEALPDPSLATNGPGRSSNGNIVVREVTVDTVANIGTNIVLQSGTAQHSQGGFSIDNAINGIFDTTNNGGSGWANDALNAPNVATFETQTTIPGGAGTTLTFKLFSGGFGTHELGKFRISATTADRALFADGNDEGGANVGTEGIWTVLDPSAVTSDNATTTFSEDASHTILAGGTPAELETYTVTVPTSLANITGIKLEALTDPSLGAGHGPGLGSNGNYVLREFTLDAVTTVPEPASIAATSLLGAIALMKRGRSRRI